MIRSRAGWKIVTLLVAFLILRAIGATIVEIKLFSSGLIAARIVCLVGWIVIASCVGFGLEWARFIAVMLLSLGTAFAVAVLLDPALLQDRLEEDRLRILRIDLIVFIATNLAIVPLLAFGKPVRGFFAKVPNMRLR